MQVLIEALSEQTATRKAWLHDGQIVEVGRAAWADISVAGDSQMAEVHFSLRCEKGRCRLRDLNTSSGTLLNGQPVSDAYVLDGDMVLAGATRFRIRVEGASPSQPGGEKRAGAASQQPAGREEFQPPAYARQLCPSGLGLFRGLENEPFSSDLARLLAAAAPLYLILDPAKLPGPATIKPPGCEHLFDWFDPDLIPGSSPLVLAAAEAPGAYDLLAEAWGQDAAVCIFSQQEKSALLSHLRALVRVSPEDAKKPGAHPQRGALAYYWPGVLSLLLAHEPAEFRSRFFQGVDAALCETAGGASWQLLAPAEFEKTLNQLGCVCAGEEAPPAQGG